ncbi:hypothetical protein FF100_04585 [Methylobacterium terricola]|uniref:Uncharacterized protein n=1 Tax=Methylobacterium terricola TaxID=2583531 RepID=A0A5C4LN44_9HYPH|nr:hypothetical protein [Methylobacterium terricola]TNC14859.1 hypothetical protein FF100_04585 [Methylobacterium terricola]
MTIAEAENLLDRARAARDYDRLLCEVSALTFEIVKAVAHGKRVSRTEAAAVVAYVERNDPRKALPTSQLPTGNTQAERR